MCSEQATANDACPFPPITKEAGFFDGILLRLFFLGSLDIYLGYSYALIIPPPSLNIVNGLQEGSSQVKIGVYGNSLFSGQILLASISADAQVIGTVPTYDKTIGLLKGYTLSFVDVVETSTDVAVFSLFGFLRVLLQWAVGGAMAAVSETMVDLANTEIGKSLNANTFQLPEIANFPTKGQTLKFSLINASVNAVASGPSTDAFLDLDAGVELRVEGKPAGGAGPFDNSIPQNGSYKTVYTWAFESENPDATFSYSLDDPVEGTSEVYALRWTESGVEMRGGVNDDWTLAPPPVV